MDKQTQPVLKVENLAISYTTRRGDVEAVRDVTFEIKRGEAIGLVGESGCGKSTVAYGIVSFLGNGRIVGGSILFQGQQLRGCPVKELRRLCGSQIAIVHQDPMQALNPSLRVGDQLSEVLITHQRLDKEEANARCVAMLKRVYMPDPEAVMRRYPHQLSGGQQQRVVIAMALLNDPALLIMDEPTTALDVTVEAAVLDLIAELRKEFDTAILYISHNLGVIARVCDQVGVMYVGEIVEWGPVLDVFKEPVHPYTRGLMHCVPRLGVTKRSDLLYPIPGQVPTPRDRVPGCVFEPRCGYAQSICRERHPKLLQQGPNHSARCLLAEEIRVEKWQQPERGEEPANAGDWMAYSEAEPILKAEGTKTYYRQESRSVLSLVGLAEKHFVKAVDGVSITVRKGATLGIVGESGCGKSTLARTIVGLEALTDGEAEFMGFDISGPVQKRDLKLIKELQMVFQNPDSTMNPSFSVGFQIGRPLKRFRSVATNRIRDEVVRLLDAVKLDASYYNRLPRQLSGGQKQRVGIARAFAAQPHLVVCDEPVSALDVSVQASILNLLLEIQREQGTALVFISHDLGVVRFISDQIAVMYLGKFCEVGDAGDVCGVPSHPYTEALLSAAPIPDPAAEQTHIRLSGNVPSALNPPKGCRFHTRCPRTMGEICETEEPPWQQVGGSHRICCHIAPRELAAMQQESIALLCLRSL